MPRYVDGFVLAVPKSRLAEYRRMAARAGKLWREHGAVDYAECVGDDLAVARGCGRSFTALAMLKPGETAVFSYIVYKSRAHRDRVNARVFKDPRMNKLCDPKDPPFAMKRMAHGGFKAIVEA